MTEPTPVEPTQEGFLDGIDQEYHSAVEPFGNKNELAKGYRELYSKMGTAVQIPGDESAPEEVSAFYNKIGRPETPEGYDSFKPDEMPEGLPYDDKFEMTMRGIAHEAGISKSQMTALVKAYNDYQIAIYGDGQNEAKRQALESDKKLQEDWGVDYKPNFEIVERACTELVPDEELRTQFAELIDAKGLRNNAIFARVFLGIGKSMLDDTITRGTPPKGPADFVPSSPNSPEMYAFGDSENCIKARAYFRAKGHIYTTND